MSALTLRDRWRLMRAAIVGEEAAGVPNVGYAGGQYSRMVAHWFASLQDPNFELRYDLAQLRARSRELVRDNGEAAGLLLDFESDIVGAQGVLLQFRAKSPRGKSLDGINDRVESAWRAWGSRRTCTVSGFETWPALQRMMLRTVVQDGEFVALRVRDPRLPFGYTLKVLDADQLDHTYNVPRDPDGVAVVMGVEIDIDGKPQAYWLWDRHPMLAGRKRERIPADRVLHVFKRARPGQLRGIPWLAPALISWKLGDRYTEAELYQSLLAAAQGGFFVNKDGTNSLAPLKDATGKTVPIPMAVEPGSARALPPGWEFQPWAPTHPTANYVGFMKAVKRVIARAVGRSYASLTGDLSDVNFSSMRTDRVREMEQNRLHQADLLVGQFAAEVFADWLPQALLKGQLGAITMDLDQLAAAATWMCKGWPWIDPLKDLQAATLALTHGLTSRQQLCAERGVDYFDIIAQLAEEAEYAREKGVVLGENASTAAPPADSGDSADAADNADSNATSNAKDAQLTSGRGEVPLRIARTGT